MVFLIIVVIFFRVQAAQSLVVRYSIEAQPGLDVNVKSMVHHVQPGREHGSITTNPPVSRLYIDVRQV